MKKTFALLISLAFILCLFSSCKDIGLDNKPKTDSGDFGKYFYVSPDGNDTNAGTKEAPLATFVGAVAKVREYKQENGLPEGGIKVEFAAGTYKLTSSVKIEDKDSGENGKTIVYAAAEGETVIFDGGITLNPADFKPANDDFKARLYSEEAKQNVLEIDLAEAGIWDADDSRTYCGGGSGYSCTWEYRQSLYVNNELQNVARWPNDGYGTSEVLEGYNGTSTILAIPSDRSDLWDKETGVRLYGYPLYDWGAYFTWNTQPVPGSGGISVNAKYSDGRPFYFFNIATELDSPGEYYWDVEANKLYYWPKDGFESSKISFSQLYDPGIDVSGSSYITIDGFTFESFRNSPVYGENSSDITIINSVFRGNSRSVWFSGKKITIDRNVFYNLGGGAIYIEGGDSSTMELSKSVVKNNLIHDIAQVYTVYNGGIIVNGMGYEIAHNEIYNSPHSAILFWSGMTTIEYNYVHDVCSETSDAGAIYSGRRWDWNGNVIRYNYICDIIDKMHGGTPMGIYLDDCLSGQTCYGNIFANIGGYAFLLGGGHYLSVYNNVMVNTMGISLDGRGFNGAPSVMSYREGILWSANVRDNYLTYLWKYAEPEFLSMMEMRATDELGALCGIVGDQLDSPGSPTYVDIHGNIGYSEQFIVAPLIAERAAFVFNRNRYLHYNNNEDDSIPPTIHIIGVAYLFGRIADNLAYIDSPEDIFVDPDNGNYLLKDDSRIYRDLIDFEKWDYKLIGIQ